MAALPTFEVLRLTAALLGSHFGLPFVAGTRRLAVQIQALRQMP